MKIKVLKLAILIKALFCMGALFALDKPKVDEKALMGLMQGNKTDNQKIYDDMPESVPAVILLSTDSKSGVPLKTINTLSEEIKNQMIFNGYFKPVTMNKWLVSNYDSEKAKSIYSFIGELKSRKYPANVKGVCKSMICKIAGDYVIKISIYPFTDNGYPISAVRFIKSDSEISNAVKFALMDLSNLMQNRTNPNIKLAVYPFTIKCKTLVEQKSGEFDFIATSFSNQEGVELKDSDDYISELFAYQAKCAGIFNSTITNPVPEYISKTNPDSSVFANSANYAVKSEVILSDKLNVITYHLVDTSNNKPIYSNKYFFKNLNISTIWDINYKFIRDCASKIFSSNDVKYVDFINNEGSYYYMNGMFAGQGNIKNIPVRSGKTIIYSGTSLTSTISINPDSIKEKDNKDYFIYTNNDEVLVYKGREGEFVWNLLEK